MKLSKELREILIGLLLGDGSLRGNPNNPYFYFDQGSNHKEYIIHLHDLLKNYTNSSIKNREYYDERYNKFYISYNFNTISSPLFKDFYELFYMPKGKKRVPLDIVNHLTPIGLAYWIMDDGQYVKRGGLTLCTDSFTLDEVELLISVLEGKFNLNCTIHNKNPRRKHYRIYISKTSLDLLRSLVIEYIHASMLYKLSD